MSEISTQKPIRETASRTIRTLHPADTDYPTMLRDIPDPQAAYLKAPPADASFYRFHTVIINKINRYMGGAAPQFNIAKLVAPATVQKEI